MRQWHTLAMFEGEAGLAGVGVGAREEAVYRVLLHQGARGAADLGRTLGLGRAEVQRALALLEEKGLISRSASRPARYHTSPPLLAVEALILRREAELRRARVRAAELNAEMALISDRPNVDLVEVVSGHEAVVQRITQVQRSARNEVLVFDRPPYVVEEAAGAAGESEHLSRGVRARVVYDRTALDVPGGLDEIRRMISQGEESRIAEGVPMKMLIADASLGLVPLRPGDETSGIVMIHPSALLDALIALFEAIWRIGMPIRLSGQVGSWHASDQEEALLTLLGAGMTDAAIASHLGIGRRTVQRRIRALMDRHGAQSRPQLLLQAARAGSAASDGLHDRDEVRGQM